MNDEAKVQLDQPPGYAGPYPGPAAERPMAPLRRMLNAIPGRAEEPQDDPSAAIGAHAAAEALKRSEARRDAILAVALAIKRRGGNPVSDWTVKDVETSYAIADQLIALSE